jgi:hypothetical protein
MQDARKVNRRDAEVQRRKKDSKPQMNADEPG